MGQVEAAAYVRAQATMAGLINAVVNPAIDWLSGKGAQPIWAEDGLVINFVATSVILSLLVALFTAYGLRHAMRTQRVEADGTVTPRRWLRRFPNRAWLLGLIFGVIGATFCVGALWLLHTAGMSTWSLAAIVAVKAVYCGLLGFVVARWVLLRLLFAAGQ